MIFFLKKGKIITMTWIFCQPYFTFEKRIFENESPGKFLNSSGEFPKPQARPFSTEDTRYRNLNWITLK